MNITNTKSDTVVTGTSSADSIQNASGVTNVTINALAGNDTVKNWGDNVSINAGAGNDSIYSDGSNVTITGGTGSDSVTNWGAKTIILGGADNDSLINAGESVTVAGDAGADTLVNQSYNVSINGGADNDSIRNSGIFVTLTATSGNNFFANLAEYVTLSGGTDSDTVHNQSANVSINTGAGNDSVQNSGATVKILLDDGDDKIDNFGSRVTISGGAGNDSIGNWADTDNVSLWSGTSANNVSISGGAGNDSIYNNGGTGVTLGGDAGNDTINNFYATVKINGGNDDDSIYNGTNATDVTINGGAGKDTVENRGDNVSINGGSGNDSISNEGTDVTIIGGDGSDTIANKTVVYATNNGGTRTVRPDSVSINGGAGNDSIINTSGENIWLGGGKAVSMGGGSGNDTLTGSTAAEIFIYESGNDIITNYSGEDTVKIATGAIDSYYAEDTDLIFNIGTGSLTLKNMQGRYITITDSSGKTTTQLYGSTGYTAQDAIKNLVHAWNKTFLSGTAKLDESVKLSTHFGTIQDAIDQMVADCRAAGNADTFLNKYCGIIMENIDTGAITGWDAGSDSIKTADNIMGETLPATQVPDYTDTTFTAGNLTINIRSTGSSLSSDGKKTFDGLYSWWADEAVKLIEDSYDFAFRDGDSIRVEMVPSATYSGNTSSSGIVKINQGNITYDSEDDYNGNGIDRTIAHEFTHVAQNYFMGHFAQFLEEGLADLTVGIDERGGKSEWIESLAANADSLASYLDLNNSGTGEVAYYAAGYMFYRYLARQAALNFDSSADYAWKDGILISGTDDADLLTGNGANSTLLAGAGNDTVTAYGESMNVFGDAGNDRIYNAGDNATITGGTGNDTITNTAANALFSYADGDGSDSIVGFNDTSTLQIAADNFSTAKSSSNIIVTVGDGRITLRGAATLGTVNIIAEEISTTEIYNDSSKSPVTLASGKEIGDASSRTAAIKITGNALDNSIYGGSGKDIIYGKNGDDYLDGGAGDDKLYGQSGNDTLWGGKGNDTLTGGAGDDLFIYSAGNDVIADYATGDKISLGAAVSGSSLNGSDAVLTIGKNTLTVKNSKELTLIDADGKELSTIIGGLTLTDSDASPVTLGSGVEYVDATARTAAIKITGNALDNSILGGAGNDLLYGKNGDDYIDGGAGNDKLYGQNGNDTLRGGTGNDTLTGGAGDDLFIYSAGNDVIADYATGDKISLGAAVSGSSLNGSDAVLTIGKGKLTVKNTKALTLIDSDGKELSTIIGGLTLTDSDASPVTLASGVEYVDATARATAIKITGNALDNIIYGGSGKDMLYGKNGDDYIDGGAGNDRLYGQNGADTLWGSTGNDTMTGGAGADLFIYTAGKDVITDFTDDDLLQITGTFTGTYNSSAKTVAFKVGSTASALTLQNVTASGTFNINGDSYSISGTELVK